MRQPNEPGASIARVLLSGYPTRIINAYNRGLFRYRASAAIWNQQPMRFAKMWGFGAPPASYLGKIDGRSMSSADAALSRECMKLDSDNAYARALVEAFYSAMKNARKIDASVGEHLGFWVELSVEGPCADVFGTLTSYGRWDILSKITIGVTVLAGRPPKLETEWLPELDNDNTDAASARLSKISPVALPDRSSVIEALEASAVMMRDAIRAREMVVRARSQSLKEFADDWLESIRGYRRGLPYDFCARDPYWTDLTEVDFIANNLQEYARRREAEIARRYQTVSLGLVLHHAPESDK